MSEDNRLNRRQALKEVAVGIGTASSLPILNQVASAEGHQHHRAPLVAESKATNAPSFFNQQQYATITELASLIIPTDETPGAREAKVNEYIDMIIKESPADVQKLYIDGLAWLDKTSKRRHQKTFVELSNSQQVSILTEISKKSEAPGQQELPAKFFQALKNATIDGFYTSKIGIEELGYQGNTVLDEFKGCTHPEHQS